MKQRLICSLLWCAGGLYGASSACGNFWANKTKNNFVDCARVIFTHRPVHALFPATIVPGSSFTMGPVFETEANGEVWQRYFKASGGITYRRFGFAEGRGRYTRRALFGGARDRLAIDHWVRYRYLPQLDYYGLGFSTKKDDRAVYRRQDSSIGAQVHNPLTSWLAVGAGIESLWITIRSAEDPGEPGRAIQDRFDEGTAPGLTWRSPHFMRYEIFARPHYPDRLPYMLDYKVAYSFFQDTRDGRYSFGRFETDLMHDFRLPLARTNHLNIRAYLSSARTAEGRQIPFYLQNTIGGWDIFNDPILRSFPDYRFRDRNLMAYQTEFMYDFFKGFGIGGFYDTGTVAPRAGDLSFGSMRHSYGLGFAMSRGDRVYFRAYLGFGGGEGVHPFWGLPKLF